MTSTWLRSKLSQSITFHPLDGSLPCCGNASCPRPSTLWQRWWSRNEGMHLENVWYCSPECFTAGIHAYLGRLRPTQVQRHKAPNRVPLGLILFSQGKISQQQLQSALRSQARARSGKIGQWLVAAGAVTEADVAAALAAQQGCGFFNCADFNCDGALRHLPEALLQEFRCVPIFYNPDTRRMILGFADRVDRLFVAAVEHVLQCCVEPGVVRESLLRPAANPQGTPESVVFEQAQNSAEMASALTCYAHQVAAEHCRIAHCGPYLWARLLPADGEHFDLLFRTCR